MKKKAKKWKQKKKREKKKNRKKKRKKKNMKRKRWSGEDDDEVRAKEGVKPKDKEMWRKWMVGNDRE